MKRLMSVIALLAVLCAAFGAAGESFPVTIEDIMAANTGDSQPLTAVCIWGIADCPQLPTSNYTWKLNSPYGGLITEKNEIKTSFDAVYHALKGE